MHWWFIAHAHPKQHERFWKWLQDREYKLEGPMLEGYSRPIPSEVRLYGIRIKEEVLADFFEDMKKHGVNLSMYRSSKKGDSENISIGSLPRKLIYYLTKLPFWPFKQQKKFKFREPETDEKANPKKLEGWIQIMSLGGSKDPIYDGEELL